ncbi:unnamed protein product [Allacma fusca]|uniref:Uncharacterized protein n=1 Tax=Allacma fusca TaxID=39272 RepID=A0A8J2KTS4_9HEXA|nr:unnamed protein product [Allacma fusca]
MLQIWLISTTVLTRNVNINIFQSSAIFLHNLRDIQLLKTCRLVCKSWTIELSDSLRACFKASFAETSSRFQDFGLELDDGGEDGLGINQHFLNIVLGENRAHITSLEIQAWSDKGFNRNEKTTTTDGYELPFLKRLKFQDYCFSCTHTQLMENIVSISQPEWLHLNIPNQKSVDCLLP